MSIPLSVCVSLGWRHDRDNKADTDVVRMKRESVECVCIGLNACDDRNVTACTRLELSYSNSSHEVICHIHFCVCPPRGHGAI